MGGVLLAALPCACASGANTDNNGGLTFGVGGPAGGTASLTEGDASGLTTGGDATDSGTGQNDSGDPTGAGCVDDDGDSFGANCPAGDDCNDDNAEVNPAADETCNGEDDNCDDEIDNGCDCTPDGVSGDCNSPFDLGSIEMGQSELGVVANVPQEDSIDWYQVSFPFTERPGVGMPSISFAINEGDAFVFDVVEERCAAAGGPCGEGGMDGLAVGLTDWTFIDDDPGCCTPPDDSLVAWPATVYLRVYRTTPGASCDAYQLQVSR
jgi:hypothetical protein